MADDKPAIHQAVSLLLSRMESHPQEFNVWRGDGSRWDIILNSVREVANEAEIKALNNKLHGIRMGELADIIMDELCNGEERRRQKQEEFEKYKHAQHAQHAQLIAQVQQLQTLYPHAYGGGGGNSLANVGGYTNTIAQTPMAPQTSAVKKKKGLW